MTATLEATYPEKETATLLLEAQAAHAKALNAMFTEVRTEIGRRIREARKRKRMTAIQLGHALGYAGGHAVHSYEAGTAKSVDLLMLAAICDVLDCSLGYLLEPTKAATSRADGDSLAA